MNSFSFHRATRVDWLIDRVMSDEHSENTHRAQRTCRGASMSLWRSKAIFIIQQPDRSARLSPSFQWIVCKICHIAVFVNVFVEFFEKNFSYDVFHLKIGFQMKGPLSCEAKFWSSWTNKHWCCWFIDANSELEPLLSTNIYGGMNFFIYVYIKGFLCWTKYVDQMEAVKHNPRVD